MKRVLILFCAALLFCGCAAQTQLPSVSPSTQPVVSSSPGEVNWQIEPVATPSPVPTPQLEDAWERGFFEIDIDKNDSYRDFVAEYYIMDTYYETVFYRLKDGTYVELGRLEGTLTGNVGGRTPSITLDGMGGIYAKETSVLASWAVLHSVYEVKNDTLTLRNDGVGRAFIEPPVFWMTEPVKLRVMEYDVWQLEGGRVGDYLTGKTVTLQIGDRVVFFASDESYALIGSFGDTYGVLFMESCDCILDGPFFGNCFYSPYVEWVG